VNAFVTLGGGRGTAPNTAKCRAESQLSATEAAAPPAAHPSQWRDGVSRGEVGPGPQQRRLSGCIDGVVAGEWGGGLKLMV